MNKITGCSSAKSFLLVEWSNCETLNALLSKERLKNKYVLDEIKLLLKVIAIAIQCVHMNTAPSPLSSKISYDHLERLTYELAIFRI